MFTCQLCKQVTPARTKAQRIVLETRRRTYKKPPETRFYKNKWIKIKKDWSDLPNPAGYEIVREVLACPVCAAAYNLQKDKA
ncbi:MAG: hypothetical protein GC179_05840 [Anaerolineaceae bacterium]|nr:hypothetical protein [Anaerolineaceae bacterium]